MKELSFGLVVLIALGSLSFGMYQSGEVSDLEAERDRLYDEVYKAKVMLATVLEEFEIHMFLRPEDGQVFFWSETDSSWIDTPAGIMYEVKP